jgi:3-mercaptopyruvate sulfurtransferase SseA
VVAESDEDLLLCETGHVPGTVKPDWHAELSAPVTRDYVDGVGFGRLMPDKGHPDVRLMDGGRAKWLAEGRAVSTEASVRRANSTGRQCDQDCRRSRARRPLPCYLRHILKLLHVTAGSH